MAKANKMFSRGDGDGPELLVKSADGGSSVRVGTSGQAKASKTAPVPKQDASEAGSDSSGTTVAVIVVVVCAVVLLAVGAGAMSYYRHQDSQAPSVGFENPCYSSNPAGVGAAQFYGGDDIGHSGATQTSGYM